MDKFVFLIKKACKRPASCCFCWGVAWFSFAPTQIWFLPNEVLCPSDVCVMVCDAWANGVMGGGGQAGRGGSRTAIFLCTCVS